MKKKSPHLEIVLEKNYENFKEFLEENKSEIYKLIIKLFDDFKTTRKKSLSIQVKGKIKDLEWDTIFTYTKKDSIILTKDILPFFEEIEDFETCIKIRDTYNEINHQ